MLLSRSDCGCRPCTVNLSQDESTAHNQPQKSGLKRAEPVTSEDSSGPAGSLGSSAEVAGVVSTTCLDSGIGRSAGILPANAAKMAALHRPAN
jgi:hypothetical protein